MAARSAGSTTLPSGSNRVTASVAAVSAFSPYFAIRAWAIRATIGNSVLKVPVV